MNEVPLGRNTVGAAPRWVHAYVWGIIGAITVVLLARYRDTDVWMLWMGNPVNPRGTFA